MANLTGGAVPQSWGAVAHSLIGGLLIYFGGYNNFEKLMKVLVGVMGFSILFCALFTLHQPMVALKGLLVPTIPRRQRHLRAVADRRRRRLDHDARPYNYWMREEDMRGSGFVSYCARRHRHRLHLHGDLRRLDHADRQRRVLHAGRGAEGRRGGAAHGGRARDGARPVRAHRLLGRLLGGGVSRRCSACGRACRISTPTSTASSRRCRPRRGRTR
jgi:hypothetical protein